MCTDGGYPEKLMHTSSARPPSHEISLPFIPCPGIGSGSQTDERYSYVCKEQGSEMLRAHIRRGLGLIACLLMQIGLMAGAFPAHATTRTHAAMTMAHCTSMAQHASVGCPQHDMRAMTSEASPHHHDSHEQDCCHIHAASAEPALALVHLTPLPTQIASSRCFVQTGHPSLSGTDWMPAPPPPKSQLS